ncbi:TPA: hypothetical protein QDC03_007958 [Burkholderia cepacia]|uniref:hypothetical protein n=1 Tax=Burkholderia cepacia TaxID=292 RepID=UPI000CFA2E85|nr:hypothetical protein [Burkholderia cepacia]HDR9508892.1 hypothetical protein [Burkholderia cepacia]HDR9512649.1 hypothetical protein [Burkholderia cepacia]
MKSGIIYVKSYKEGSGVVDFIKEVYKHPELSHFLVARMDAINVREYFREYIVENGISPLFNFSLTCDAVMHGGIHVDEILDLVIKFVEKLKGVKDLFIIDPYFYSDDPDCVALFGKMMSVLSEQLRSVTFFTNGSRANKKLAMHSILQELAPEVLIGDVVTDEFHDRFWVDAEKNAGIVMGTSLNGIGKKIALIDHLSESDARDIARLAGKLIKSTE